METAASLFTAIVALEHLYIMWLEMFAWETAGKKVFGGSLADELFKPTKKLAANQGLYNGFLAAGLIWSFFIQDPIWSTNIRIFFLSAVSIAALFGGFTASKSILIKQGIPAFIALIIVLLSKYL